MNADGKGLFAAICADPEDDTPRLVYTDWLDEQGEADRASALRMSVERRRLPDWEPRKWVLDARLYRLWQQHRKSWNAALPDLPNVYRDVGQSGLVESVQVGSPDVLLRQEEAIFSLGPIETIDVMLMNAAATAAENAAVDAAVLTRCGSLARVRSLTLSAAESPEALKLPALAASPFLQNLRHLDLSSSDFSSPLIRYFANCPPFPCLESLTLERNELYRGLDALAKSPLMGTIRKLDLKQCGIGNSGLRQLLRCPTLPAFRSLILSECDLGPAVFKRFFEADWQALEYLDVSENNLGSVMTRHLGRCAGMKHLRWLDVSACQGNFGDKALQALADSDYLGQLRVLAIGFNDVTHVGFDALAHADWAPNLTRLELPGTDMGRPELVALASPSLGNLRWLDLGYAELTDAEIPTLLEISCLPHLTHLDLSNNEIGIDGARALADAPLDDLEHLDLTDNKISEAGRERLRERFGDRVRLVNSPDT